MRFSVMKPNVSLALAAAGLLGLVQGQTETEEPTKSPCTHLADGIQHIAELEGHLQGIIFFNLRTAPAPVQAGVNTIFSRLEEQVNGVDKIRRDNCDLADTLDNADESICESLQVMANTIVEMQGVVDELRDADGADVILDFPVMESTLADGLVDVQGAIDGFTSDGICTAGAEEADSMEDDEINEDVADTEDSKVDVVDGDVDMEETEDAEEVEDAEEDVDESEETGESSGTD